MLLQVAKELVRQQGGVAGAGLGRAATRTASTSSSKPQSVRAQAQEAVELSSGSALPLTFLSDEELMMKETGGCIRPGPETECQKLNPSKDLTKVSYILQFIVTAVVQNLSPKTRRV